MPIGHDELIQARAALLERIVAFFAEQPNVIGIFLAGSIPAGTDNAYACTCGRR
jgi:hypothetical protein